MQNRRNFLKTSVIAGIGLVLSPTLLGENLQLSAENDDKIKQKAAKIHKRIFKLDSHCDTPLQLIRTDFQINQSHDGLKTHSCVDFPRMTQGDMNAMFWAVFVGQSERSEAGNEKVIAKAKQIFDAIHKTIAENSQVAEIAISSTDGIEIAKKGKHAIYIGVENGYAIGNNLNLLEEYYKKGARYITLCHSANNDICDSSSDKNGAEHNGVSEFGKKVIAEMNRLGILIDVSHISDKAFYDAIQLSKTPIVATHSCARALCDHPRNMTDDMIKELAKNGGVIQMCILSDYVKTPEPFPERDAAKQKVRDKYNNFKDLTDQEMAEASKAWYAINDEFPPKLATVKDVVNHIDHIVKLVGINHIGIGTDFDGGGGVADCYDVSQIGNITEELVRRGYSEKEIRKIWGENFLRVMQKTEAFAAK